jgi:hypothetical protein
MFETGLPVFFDIRSSPVTASESGSALLVYRDFDFVGKLTQRDDVIEVLSFKVGGYLPAAA